MKKNFIKLAAAVALSILFSGCYFFVQLDADLKVVNNTDKTFYCLAAYNKYVGSNPTHWEVGPNATVNKTLKGHLTEADYADSTEYLYFWYIEKEVYEARVAEHPDRDDYYIMIH